MDVLPIKLLTDEDGPVIGTDLLNLGRLAQSGFPVADGLIVTPPALKLNTILSRYQLHGKELFEQKLLLIREDIRRIPCPEEVNRELAKKGINTKKLWLHLLDFWLGQIRSKIWREGFSPDIVQKLDAQPVFFTTKIKAAGACFYDYDRNVCVFDIKDGRIEDGQKEELAGFIGKADKRLFLPQVYDWVLEKEILIVKVTPFTHYSDDLAVGEIIPKGFAPQQTGSQKIRSTVKILLQADDSFRTEQDLDGVLISSAAGSDFDQKLLQLVEFATAVSPNPAIFKLFDSRDKNLQVRGALNLLHNGQDLKKDAEAILFARNSKGLANVYPAVSFVRSSSEFGKLKQALAGLKISRSANLKLYLELAVPENFLNIGEYLEVGFDGAIVNLDELSYWVGGFDPNGEEANFYKKQVKAIIGLTGPVFNTLRKEKVPIIAAGELALHDDVLGYLIEEGLWGLGVNFANFNSIHERIRLIEARIVRLRSKG